MIKYNRVFTTLICVGFIENASAKTTSVQTCILDTGIPSEAASLLTGTLIAIQKSKEMNSTAQANSYLPTLEDSHVMINETGRRLLSEYLVATNGTADSSERSFSWLEKCLTSNDVALNSHCLSLLGGVSMASQEAKFYLINAANCELPELSFKKELIFWGNQIESLGREILIKGLARLKYRTISNQTQISKKDALCSGLKIEIENLQSQGALEAIIKNHASNVTKNSQPQETEPDATKIATELLKISQTICPQTKKHYQAAKSPHASGRER
jgi:hypothetical protein